MSVVCYLTFWLQAELIDAQKLQASRPVHTVLDLGQDVGSEGVGSQCVVQRQGCHGGLF